MSKGTVTTDRFVLFWGGWPSQWAKANFVVDGVAAELSAASVVVLKPAAARLPDE